MNDGGLENRKEHGKSQKQSKSSKFNSKSDDFALAIAKVAVAQVCESVGFQSFQHSALQTLSDIIVQYIYNIGKTANINANLAGRVEANVFDVLQRLEELGSGLGFAGASDADRCVVNSGIVRDIVHFVGEADDFQFAYDVPQFPVVKEWKETGSFWEKGEEPPGKHIPNWLPVFPDPETYAARTSEGTETMSVLNGEKSELASFETKMERSLLNLQQRFACNGNEGGSSHDGGDAVRAREAAESNPYLAAPLHFGEKEVEVSPVVLPVKLSNEVALKNIVSENCIVGNHVSVLETFAPAIEAMKSGFCDSENRQKKVLHNQRPMVHFKIETGKKSLGSATNLNSQKKDLEKIALWFGNDNEEDDQKRRSEKILKEPMENCQELA
ncbi:PREDICTED: LOW QUALITY PROTEIN: transcription initiation factor TFIID subunit 8 [Theobroma cacao]|uniref:Transcription initiation factor TFIID subunit 8 n=1 Tax=Theobroma cacao TaxID=3641 RepID=A0AB32V870_THECC|nr:PREDICTED: LOW QUALITY PROTEIN: transcription initiation factor TFIID subunit 8 [Theobroma cacao]